MAERTTDVALAAGALASGKLVAFATETVYGLGANALDAEAVARVFAAKQRPTFDPLIVHLADPGDLSRIAEPPGRAARQLIDRFWPGPLTLVLPKKPIVPDLVTAGLPTVAVRVPAHDQARELIRLSGVPVAAPSANPFGAISPTTAQHVLDQLGDRIDFVLDGGPCRVGIESTVLLVEDSQPPLLLRPGGLPVEEIEAVSGPVARLSQPSVDPHLPQTAPGMLSRHYAPRTPLRIAAALGAAPRGSRMGLLTLTAPVNPAEFAVVETLSMDGSLTEAAAQFFAALRRLDAAGLDLILARPFPETGLGRALNDRLRRAAHDGE